MDSLDRFRPLIGVSFCKQNFEGFTLKRGFVFVPLSGLASVNKMGFGHFNTETIKVFVPLSGLASVNVKTTLVYAGVGMGFRPLIGVSFCKQARVDFPIEWRGHSFRPLIGVSFCKRSCKRLRSICLGWCFRPLIGVSFCKR